MKTETDQTRKVTREFLASINHINGEKFSPNLHAFLSEHFSEYTDYSVFRHGDGSLFVGYVYDGDFIGARINQALGEGRKCVVMCYSGLQVEEIPDFWDEYLRIGRCVLDKEHSTYFLNAEHRYSQDGDTRTCNWCGQKQTLKRWEEVVKRESWRNIP